MDFSGPVSFRLVSFRGKKEKQNKHPEEKNNNESDYFLRSPGFLASYCVLSTIPYIIPEPTDRLTARCRSIYDTIR